MSAILEENGAEITDEFVDYPAWFTKLKEEGQKAYEEASWPTKKDENWRFGRPKNAQITEIPYAEEEGMVMDIEPAPEGVIRFTFVNGYCMSVEGEIPEGLIALPLNRAIHEVGECLESAIPPIQGKLGSGKLAAFHRASLEDGAAIQIGENVSIESPIEIVHLFTGEGRAHTYLLVVAGENSQVSITESFQSTNDDDASTVLAVSDIQVKKGANFKYLCAQELNEKSKLIRIGESVTGEGADSTTAVLHIGSQWVRDEFYSTVAGKHAECKILSVSVPKGSQEFDQRTFQHHASESCHSDLLYKNALYDKAKTIFSGLIFVDEGAHHTDAYQTCRNLLMSDTCEANSMPGLEINADQVACSHGSTSAQVSDEEIFYLQARGIPADQAREIIAEGFCTDVFQKLNSEALIQFYVKKLKNTFTSFKNQL